MHHRHYKRGSAALLAVAALVLAVASGGAGPSAGPAAVPAARLAPEVSRNLSLAVREGLYRAPRDPVLSPRLARRAGEAPEGEILVWVFLTDKGVGTPAGFRDGLEAVRDRLGPRVRARREALGSGLGLDFRDLPVYRGYVDALEAVGIPVRRESRWLNAVSLRIPARRLPEIAALPFVHHVQPVRVKLAANVPNPLAPGPDSWPRTAPPSLTPWSRRSTAPPFTSSTRSRFWTCTAWDTRGRG
jgi:hypothetical protein